LEPGQSKLRSCSRRAGALAVSGSPASSAMVYAALGPGGNIQAGMARNSGVHDGAPDQVEAEQAA
jgi:hypothetical protein